METLLSNIQTILGPLLVGALCAAAMYGVTCIQTVHYLYKHSRDNRWYKLCVCMLWMLDTFHMFMISHFTYWFLVSNYLNVLALANPVWSLRIIVGASALNDVLVRLLFAKRVWLLSKGNLLITLCICAFSIMDLASGIVLTVKAFGKSGQTANIRSSVSSTIYVNFVSVIVADLVIAASLAWYLWHARTGFRRTDNLITILLVYVIGTGFLTVVLSVVTLATYTTLPNNYVYFAAYMLMPKVYFNSLLYSLNARDMLRDNTDGIISVHLSQIRRPSQPENTSGTCVSTFGIERSPGFVNSADVKE